MIRQLRREAREAAERLIEVLEDSERESHPVCMNEQIRKNNSSTKMKNQSKEMGTREMYDYQLPTSRILTNGISTNWMLDMATRNVTVKVVM